MNPSQQSVIVSVIALIVSVLSLTIAMLNYRRDRAKIKLVLRESRIANARPPYRSDILYKNITATNIGRRPRIIKQMGHKNLWDFKKDAMWGDALGKNPTTLGEGESITYLAEYENVIKKDWDRISHFFVVDSTGKEKRLRKTDIVRYGIFIMLLWLYDHKPFKKRR